MNVLCNYTGSKICESCINHAITSYVFINRTHYIRSRLETCITKLLDHLKEIDNPKGKLFIEINHNGIVPAIEDNDVYIDDILGETNVEESKLKVDVLEDEFRIISESESDMDEESNVKEEYYDNKDTTKVNPKTTETKLVNGLGDTNQTNIKNACSEFLTFKKKPKSGRMCKFTCPLCSKHFISDYFLKKHVLKHLNKTVVCKICELKFKSKFHLDEHMKMTHLTKEKYKGHFCKTCGSVFDDENKLLEHWKSHIAKECQLCLKTFNTQTNFNSHLQRHFKKLSILKQRNIQTCSFCEKECLNDNDLSIHVNKVHLQIKPYGCDMCEKKFYTHANMKQHKIIHNLPSKEICQFCNKRLRSRKSLVIHVRKHIGSKPYRCLICPQTFYSESKMMGHIKKRHGGSFDCRLCHKVFINKKELKNHVIRAHSVF